MSQRARMGELAGLLLGPEERAGTVSPPPAPQQKTRKKKTEKPVFGKVASRGGGPAPGAGRGSPVHRPYGERGDFEKVTVTLPAEVRARLLEESLRRKTDRSPDWPIAAIVREALAAYLAPKP